MSGEEFSNLRVGDVVRERQAGSTAKVILAFDAVERKALTKPQHGEHPQRWIAWYTLHHRFDCVLGPRR